MDRRLSSTVLRRFILILALGVAGVPAAEVRGHTPPPGSPLARREHPRVWLTRDNVAGLRTKLAGPMRTEYQGFVAYLDRSFDSADLDGDGAQEHTLNYAFVYRVGAVPGIAYGRPIAEYGQQARRLVLRRIARGVRLDYWPAVAYDWLHDILTGGERAQVWDYVRRANDRQDKVKDPWDDRSSRTVQRQVLAGLAFWGDGLDGGEANTWTDLFNSQVRGGGMLDAANIIAADDGGVSEGFAYAARGDESSSIQNLLLTLEGWRTANGLTREAVFGGTAATALRYFPQWVAYLIRPHAVADPAAPGGHVYMPYKTHHADADRAIGTRGPLRTLLSSLRMFRSVDPDTASLAQWLLENRVGVIGDGGADWRDKALIGHFLFGEKVEPRSPEAIGLPRSKVFEGLGWVALRTGFTSLGDTLVTFTASPWRRSAFTNLNQNSFTIDRRGPLALNSGHRTHHLYANSTWAYNTMIFPDPAAPEAERAEGADLGGQRRSFQPGVTNSQMLAPGSMYDLGGLRRFQAADPGQDLDFDYVLGDATRAYNGPANLDTKNAPKVVNFTRQLVYFRPASAGAPDRVVVFDRTQTTDARFEKRWLLHTSFEPTVSGRSQGPTRDGRSRYSDVSEVVALNTAAGSNGRLRLRTLLPERNRVEKIGGPGHEFEDPYGRNDPSDGFDPADSFVAQYVGTYRIEIAPQGSGQGEIFLNVLEASEADRPADATVSLFRGNGIVAARVDDRVAAFATGETRLSSGDLVFGQRGSYRVLFCDLEPTAEYEIANGGAGTTAYASAAGLLYVRTDVAAGARVTLRATGRRQAGVQP